MGGTRVARVYPEVPGRDACQLPPRTQTIQPAKFALTDLTPGGYWEIGRRLCVRTICAVGEIGQSSIPTWPADAARGDN